MKNKKKYRPEIIDVLDVSIITKVKKAAKKLGYQIQESGKYAIRFFDTDEERVFFAIKSLSSKRKYQCTVNIDFGRQVGLIK